MWCAKGAGGGGLLGKNSPKESLMRTFEDVVCQKEQFSRTVMLQSSPVVRSFLVLGYLKLLSSIQAGLCPLLWEEVLHHSAGN